MNSAKTPQNFRSVASSLTRKMLLGALLCTLIVVALQMVWVARQERLGFDEQVAQVMQTYQPLLVTAVWDIEPSDVQHLLDGITSAPTIRCALLEVSTGQRFTSCDGKPDTSVTALPEAFVTTLPNPQMPASSLATLRIEFSPAYLRDKLKTVALQLAIAAGTLTLVLACVSQWIVRRELLSPMHKIAQFAATLAPGKLARPLNLNRSKHRQHRDEIDQVGEGFLTLQSDVARYVSERKQHEASLAAFAADLDNQVKLRTVELKKVSEYLEALSVNSSLFLNVAPDDFAPLMRRTLQELSQFLSGTPLALAVQQDADAPLRWLYVWQPDVCKLSPLHEGQTVPAHLLTPLRQGWAHQRTQSLAAAAPEHAKALAQLGAKAMASVGYLDGDASHYLVTLSANPRSWKDVSERLAQLAAYMLFNALQRHNDQLTMLKMHNELQQLSNTDALTGLANRRHFDVVKFREMRRAIRNGSPLSVISIDIDYFKAYNDHYGHGGGDIALALVAQAISLTFHRAGELPARIGGEEFVVLLPNQSLQEAFEQGERLRARIFEQKLPHAKSPLGALTVSVGVASVTPERLEPPSSTIEETINALIKGSDQALYDAKNGGRNQVRQAA